MGKEMMKNLPTLLIQFTDFHSGWQVCKWVSGRKLEQRENGREDPSREIRSTIRQTGPKLDD